MSAPPPAHSGPGPVPSVGKAWPGQTYWQTGDSEGRPEAEDTLACLQLPHQGEQSYVLLCPPTSLPGSLVQEHENREKHNQEHRGALPQDWIRGIIILKEFSGEL